MASFTPPDQPVRSEIATEDGRSVVVEASAGTGKTTLLTRRVSEIVRRGVPLDRIAVVTFTEAAASELRLRIREVLPPEAAAGMDQAWIHTIHGFASRILREYYHLCGGLPEFVTEPGHFSRSELEMLWDVFLASADAASLGESSPGLRRPGSRALLDAAEAMEKHRWIQDPSILGSMQERFTELRDRWERRLPELAAVCPVENDKLRLGILEAAERLRQGDLNSPVALNCGSRAAWGGAEAIVEVRGELKRFRSDLESMRGWQAMRPVLPAVENLVFPFLRHIRSEWDSNPSRLSYDDLLYAAEKGVSSSGELRSILREKFDHVLIDEFQDTSLVQVRLFRSMLGDEGFAGKLTVVGDPKQSIYGWRSADMETYKETVDRLEEGNALSRTITVNFRSCRRIISFVNSFGEALFRGSSPGEAPFASPYSPIEPAPGADDGEGVTIHVLPRLSERRKAETWSALQAVRMADLIGDPGRTAVLFRTKTRMDGLLRELDRRNIPYRVEAGRDFAERPEVTSTALLLRHMLHPKDPGALVETLRSIFFGIDDIQISRWRRGDAPSKDVSRALEILSRLREDFLNLPPGLFIRHLYRNTCLLRSIRDSGYQTGRRLANMRFIMEHAVETGDCIGLLESLEGRAPMSAEEPVTPPDDSTGAVTVTTIHSAKGLAWEHVIVADPGSSFGGIRSDVLVNERESRLGLKLGDAMSADYPPLKEREELRRVAEYRRLLYVAVTRARSRLDIILEPSGNPESPCGMIQEALAGAKDCTTLEIPLTDVPGEGDTLPHPPPPAPGEPYKQLFPGYPANSDPLRKRAMRLGTEVHGILQHIHMENPGNWIDENRNRLNRTLEYPEEAIGLAMAFFRAYDLKGARVVGREHPITAGGRFYYVDLLLERNGILEAVDYKTDAGDPGKAADLYRDHQLLYRSLLEEATGKQVRSFLVFLCHGVTIPV